MSAPAPAVAARERTVKVRLADAAGAAGCVSLLFSFLLVVLPKYVPHLIIENWFTGHLTEGLLLVAVVFNCGLYIGIARVRLATTAPLAYLAIGIGTAVTVLWFSWIVPGAVLATHWKLRDRVYEEVLFLFYFALVASIFFPFLLIRLTQELKRKQG